MDFLLFQFYFLFIECQIVYGRASFSDWMKKPNYAHRSLPFNLFNLYFSLVDICPFFRCDNALYRRGLSCWTSSFVHFIVTLFHPHIALSFSLIPSISGQPRYLSKYTHWLVVVFFSAVFITFTRHISDMHSNTRDDFRFVHTQRDPPEFSLSLSLAQFYFFAHY